MYLTGANGGYNRYGEQTSRGLFLVLLNPDDVLAMEPLRAVVRSVRLREVGHFMMGSTQIGPYRATLSGSYGADGLALDVPRPIYECGLLVPEALMEAWNKGGGHNGAGSEAPELRRWALDNLTELHNAKPAPGTSTAPAREAVEA